MTAKWRASFPDRGRVRLEKDCFAESQDNHQLRNQSILIENSVQSIVDIKTFLFEHCFNQIRNTQGNF